MKARVNFIASASQYVEVEIDDAELEGLEEEEINEMFLDRAYDEMQDGLCNYCSGGGYSSNFSIDMGQFEPVEDDAVEIQK